jgi:hypothetical protein
VRDGVTVSSIHEAVEALLHEPPYRGTAARVAAGLDAMPSAAQALDAVVAVR